jgi:hypothetical protein
MMTDDSPSITEPPWSSDVAGIIYAVNGRPGLTTVATLRDGANAETLAAAPDLLQALKDSMECLEQQFAKLPPCALRNAVLEARTFADTAIARARVGYPRELVREHPWTVNPQLPPSELEANGLLLAAAEDLWDGAMKAYAALAGHVDNIEVVGSLSKAIARTNRVIR